MSNSTGYTDQAQREREARLPAWAREIISDLRQRLQYAREPLVSEIAKLRPEIELLRARNHALNELLSCAAKGGHIGAEDIMNVIEGYELVLSKKEE